MIDSIPVVATYSRNYVCYRWIYPWELIFITYPIGYFLANLFVFVQFRPLIQKPL